jgi:hypothetical protein
MRPLLRQFGVDLKVQEELLGHADIRTTLNVHTQAVSEQKRAAYSKVVQMVLAWSVGLWADWTFLDVRKS